MKIAISLPPGEELRIARGGPGVSPGQIAVTIHRMRDTGIGRELVGMAGGNVPDGSSEAEAERIIQGLYDKAKRRLGDG